MVALTYDVRTVHIPVPRLVLRSGRARLQRPRAAFDHRPQWVRAERLAAERRGEAHREAALTLRSGAGY